jgi:hypothetical protein
MRTFGKSTLRIALLAALAIPATAFGQVPEDTDAEERTADDAQKPKPAEDLPSPRSDDDPTPPAANVLPPEGRIVKQAGIGGPVAYARQGVLELGGSASFTSGGDFTQLSLRPSIGWFLTDNFEISGILSVSYASVDGASATTWGALAEPSFHLALSSNMWAFLGLGLGVSHVDEAGTGFAMAPRLGMNFLVGRSGILTPALLLQYSTTDAIETPQGTLVAVTTSFGFNVGYTVMW